MMEFGLSRTILLASTSLAGLQPARELVADQLRTGLRPGSSYVEIAWTCLQQVGNQVCDQLASWSQTC